MYLLNILYKLAQYYYTEKWQLLIVLIKVILLFCYNSVKYEANFSICLL